MAEQQEDKETTIVWRLPSSQKGRYVAASRKAGMPFIKWLAKICDENSEPIRLESPGSMDRPKLAASLRKIHELVGLAMKSELSRAQVDELSAAAATMEEWDESDKEFKQAHFLLHWELQNRPPLRMGLPLNWERIDEVLNTCTYLEWYLEDSK